MPLTAQAIETILLQGLPDAAVTVMPVRADNDFFLSLCISSPRFDGLSRLEQHRIVYRCLSVAGFNDFENISIRTLTGKERYRR